MTAADATTKALGRLEERLDVVVTGQGAILERLAGLEATTRAEASERATVNNYTRAAIEQLQKEIDEERAARQADKTALQGTVRWAVGLGLSGLAFPLIVGLVWALANGGFAK